MGLLLSVLIVCVGVFEALDCYYHFRAGLLPPARAAQGGPPSGWRYHLTNLNERWRRKPSAALTCGVRGGEDPGSAAITPTLDAFEDPHLIPTLNGRPHLNGRAASAEISGNNTNTSPSRRNVRNLTSSEPLNFEEKAGSCTYSPGNTETASCSQVNENGPSSDSKAAPIFLLPDLFQENEPRRLSEAFPEVADVTNPGNLEFLKTRVDLPRRLSDIEAQVPPPIPSDFEDQPRRLSDPFLEKSLYSNLNDLQERNNKSMEIEGSFAAGSRDEDSSLALKTIDSSTVQNAVDESEPTSPTKKSNFDISWPSFHPSQHILKRIPKIDDIISVDVEDGDESLKFLDSNALHSNQNTQFPLFVIPNEPREHQDIKLDSLKEIKDPVNENLLADKNDSFESVAEFENTIGTSQVEGNRLNDLPHSRISQETPQTVEPQKPTDSQLNSGLRSETKVLSQSEVDEDTLQSSFVKDQLTTTSGKEYMEFLNFLFLLRAQEESPDDHLLEEYFKEQRRLEFESNDNASPAQSRSSFKEYDELVSFLKSLSLEEPEVKHVSCNRNDSEQNLSSPHGAITESLESSDLNSLGCSFPDAELVNVITEPQRLQKPARSHSFEEASPDLSASLTKAAIEFSTVKSDGEEINIKTRLSDMRTRAAELEKIEEKKQKIVHRCRESSGSAKSIGDVSEGKASQLSGMSGATCHDSALSEVSNPTPSSPPSSKSRTKQPEAFWLIFSGEYTKAMSKDWHSGHFCCWQCDESLTGQRYVLRDDHPYCIKCYESVFANTCEECSKIIGIDSKDLSYKDKHWHEACFLCSKCRVSLVDKQFGSKADHIYCGNCYDAQFASRCDGCGEIFRAGTKKMEYKTRQWHEKCFCCVVCKTAIGTKSFIPREQEIYCATCYEEKFATRCVKCNKIITTGGVTYKNEPWHRECFTCTNCNTSLAGQRFTSRDEKPYCADCFGELFAKRCTACSKPITGIGGTRFISFEDRHWHNDCFICASCKTSLVGRGFITDADDIICPECAKQKLM